MLWRHHNLEVSCCLTRQRNSILLNVSMTIAIEKPISFTFLKCNFLFLSNFFQDSFMRQMGTIRQALEKPLTHFFLFHLLGIIRARASGFARQTFRNWILCFLLKTYAPFTSSDAESNNTSNRGDGGDNKPSTGRKNVSEQIKTKLPQFLVKNGG